MHHPLLGQIQILGGGREKGGGGGGRFQIDFLNGGERGRTNELKGFFLGGGDKRTFNSRIIGLSVCFKEERSNLL